MRSGRKELDSGQLRSRKSTMVPRVSQMSHHSSQAVELKEIGDHHVSPWETGLDLGTSFTASQSMTSTFRETGITDNGNVMHSLDSERTSHESVEGSSYGVGEDDEDDFKDDEERQLLSSEQHSEHQDVVIENELRDQEVMVREAEDKESSLGIMLQILVPYLIAGFGMVGAGMVLDVVQHSEVFTNITELFILVPALLGLKGNLEMTLASRLSTQANLGNMDTRKEKIKMVCGNLVLVQAQATVVGFLASMFAMVMGWIPKGQFPLDHALLLCASSLFTAAVASFILGSLMVCVVMLSRKVNINPDNVATPIAASLGDLTTLALLAGVGKLLYSFVGKQIWLSSGIIALFFMLLPIWIVLAVKNKYTNDVIYSGWTPVLSAMVISSLGGVILDFAVSSYHGIAVFQPVINGVGGNLVAVQASRISTYLHRRGRPGKLPTGVPGGSFNPFAFFCGKSINSRAARVLLLLVIPGHLLFIYTIYYMKAGHTSITILFNLFYLLAALLQVLLLLYICQWMVHCIWSCGEDPDNVAIPYLTAIGDLLGTGFLALAFHLLYLVGDRDADLGE